MQGKTHKNAPQWYEQNLLEPCKRWLKRAKLWLKSGILGSKSGQLGLKNDELATFLERQKRAKCRFFLKNRHVGRSEKQEIVVFYLLFNPDFR